MLEWLIIGGGPHGVHAAARLVGEAGVPAEAVRIVDDEEVLLARWRRCARNTGMRYLRSPGVHHLDLSSASLQRFSKSGRGRRVSQPFTRPYSRPSLELFDRHCDEVIERYGLEDLHVRGRVDSLEILDDFVRVGVRGPNGGESESLEAKRVILALGAPERPEWPEWARGLMEADGAASTPAPIQHIFDPGFELVDDPDDQTIAVVGGGISGAQVALRLASEGRRILLLSRHPLRVHQFDSDPGWQGPKYMAGFSRLQDNVERRRRIAEARHRGSVPPDVQSALRVACADGRIEHLEEAEVEAASLSEGRIALQVDGREIVVDRLLLATGFPRRRPGEGWLDQAIEKHDLPCAECGYPIVDRGLRWHPRILVTGPLAELEIGPVSRNLSGAMRAGERIVAVARTDLVY